MTSTIDQREFEHAPFLRQAGIRWLILITAVFAWTEHISAAIYYVDYAAGSNSNNGLSKSTPWKHVPGDPAATAMPASKTLVSGDIVLFKGGVAYVGSISFNWSGSSSSPITYDGITWNGSRAVITTNNVDAFAMSDSNDARSNLVIQGFFFRDIGGYAETDPIWSKTTPITKPPGGTGIVLTGGGSNVLIENCNFSEIGQWQNIAPMSGTTSVTGAGISLQDNSHVIIRSCDFTRMKTGVSLKSTKTLSDIKIENSTFHNYMNWLIDIAPRAAGATLRNITIDGCALYDYKEFDTPNWQGLGEKPHQDGIFIRTAGMRSTWENIVIRNTRFSSDQGGGGGTASIYISQGPSVDIYNCVFLNDNHSNAYVNVGYEKISGMTQSVRLWNNTFIGGSRAFKVTPGNSNPDYVEVRNNAFVRTAPYDVISINPADIGTLVMDNNVFYGENSKRAVHDGSAYLTLDEWKQKSGKDSNSKWSDVQFVSLNGAPSTWNVRPASSASALVGSGANLSSFFTTTIDKVTRSSQWDVGAFSYSGVETRALDAPTNARTEIR